MNKLGRCACGGFVANGAGACPHCGAAIERSTAGRKLGALGVALGGSAIAFTLMACYGRPPCPEGDRDCYGPRPPAGTQDGGKDDPVAKDPSSTPAAADAGAKK